MQFWFTIGFGERGVEGQNSGRNTQGEHYVPYFRHLSRSQIAAIEHTHAIEAGNGGKQWHRI